MNNLNRVSGEISKYYSQPPVEEGLINETLPFEIFVRVLSYLDMMDIKKTCLVNRVWTEASIDTAKRKEFSLLKAFAKFLVGNLHGDDYKAQRKAFCDMGSNTLILNSVNLMEVKSSIHGLRENFLNILKDLKPADLQFLEELSENEVKPHLFNNVFTLTRYYKQLDEANKISYQYQKGLALWTISKVLVTLGNIAKAIEVANTIPDPDTNEEALLDIFNR